MQRAQQPPAVVGVDVQHQRLAGQPVGVDAQQLRRPAVGLADGGVRVGDEVRVGRAFEQLQVPLPLVLQQRPRGGQLVPLLVQLLLSGVQRLDGHRQLGGQVVAVEQQLGVADRPQFLDARVQR